MWSLGKVVAEYLDGVCASGIYEARLGREEYGGEIATYCAGYKAEDLPAIIKASDHVIFNSPAQIARFRPQIDAARRTGKAFDIGLRINPEHRDGEVEKYDPCQSHSRLGRPISQLRASDLEGVSRSEARSVGHEWVIPCGSRWSQCN